MLGSALGMAGGVCASNGQYNLFFQNLNFQGLESIDKYFGKTER
jgi:hypothetical protein